MSPFTLATLLGLLATLLFNVGMGVQKAGASVLSRGIAAFKNAEDRRLLAIWLLGTLMTVGAVLVQGVALHYGPASVIAALNGMGLVALAAFSALVLRERLRRLEIAGMGLAVAGVSAVGCFAAGLSGTSPGLNLRALAGGDAAVISLLGIFAWVSARQERTSGLALGALAGALGGTGVLILKAANLTSAWGWSGAAWLLVTAVSFAFTQVAYQRGRAIEVVPAFSAASILVPIILAPAAFGEVVTAPMWAGVALLLAGVTLLGAASGRTEYSS